MDSAMSIAPLPPWEHAALAFELSRLKAEGKKIVFTNGCFDILHAGHVRYLATARELGDVLVVGLNSDDSVRRLSKGPERPICSQDERAIVLSALSSVDYVTVFDEDTPYELIKKLKPDILVKGGDWPLDQIVGRNIVEAEGGHVTTIPFVEGKSTTDIIERIISKLKG